MAGSKELSIPDPGVSIEAQHLEEGEPMKASQLLIECAHRRILMPHVLLDDPIEMCRPPGQRTKGEMEWVIGQILKMHRADRATGHAGMYVKVEPFDCITFGFMTNDRHPEICLIDDLQVEEAA